jgi:hypothetical protein
MCVLNSWLNYGLAGKEIKFQILHFLPWLINGRGGAVSNAGMDAHWSGHHVK